MRQERPDCKEWEVVVPLHNMTMSQASEYAAEIHSKLNVRGSSDTYFPEVKLRVSVEMSDDKVFDLMVKHYWALAAVVAVIQIVFNLAYSGDFLSMLVSGFFFLLFSGLALKETEKKHGRL